MGLSLSTGWCRAVMMQARTYRTYAPVQQSRSTDRGSANSSSTPHGAAMHADLRDSTDPPQVKQLQTTHPTTAAAIKARRRRDKAMRSTCACHARRAAARSSPLPTQALPPLQLGTPEPVLCILIFNFPHINRTCYVGAMVVAVSSRLEPRDLIKMKTTTARAPLHGV